MEIKTPWWHYLLLGISASVIFKVGRGGTLPEMIALILSIIVIIIFGVILPLKK